ncbi:ABC transporter permease [Novosphingobium sp. Fuku2-ISO-50]|uniref:ABC transporter permease n=1 Tax=Novosphingobium sp. Fuku2-ISO-50 TaxID=1739114 RepID=UPI00076C69EB|nr:ABC transporter permease subunit [Novosphingobium sp. Fuku2-ISO-50]KUR79639.1 ABC transporter permease [Novosphingobium sp. Fuku2-ISO-50]
MDAELSVPALLGLGADGWGWALMAGAGLTLAVALAAMAIGSMLGAALAAAEASRRVWLVRIAATYGLVMRGVPELLVVLLLYFGAPGMLAGVAGLFGLPAPGSPPAFLTGSLAIGLVSAAYQAEVFRGGMLAVPRGQIEAAMAAGMGPVARLRRVILPQVLHHVLPPLGNIWQFNLKDSALVSITGLAELMRVSLVAAGSTRRPFVFFAAAMVLYLILTSASSALFRMIERRGSRWAGGR